MSITVAFLQGIAGGLLVIIFLVAVAGGLLLAAVFGRGGGGRPQDAEEMLEKTGGSLLPGRIFCAIGLGLAVTGGVLRRGGDRCRGYDSGCDGLLPESPRLRNRGNRTFRDHALRRTAGRSRRNTGHL